MGALTGISSVSGLSALFASGAFQFTDVTAQAWTAFWQPELQNVSAQNVNTLNVNTTGDVGNTFGTTVDKWYGAVLAEDGNIYGIPYDRQTILKIVPGDTPTITEESSGITGGDNWVGGVLGGDGKIYGVPYNATDVIKITPGSPPTYSRSGSVAGSFKYGGGCLGPDGKIYCIPINATQVLRITPNGASDPTLELVGNTFSGSGKWTGGILAGDGYIYGIPRNATTVLRIKPGAVPVCEEVTDAGSGDAIPTGNLKWISGALGPDGVIYGIPYNSPDVIRIVPNGDSDPDITIVNASLGVGGDKWVGGCMGPDGYIYGIPRDETSLLQIQPGSPPTIGTVGSVAAGSAKWHGGILTPDGDIYCAPRNYTHVLRITFDNTVPFSLQTYLTPYLNKL